MTLRPLGDFDHSKNCPKHRVLTQVFELNKYETSFGYESFFESGYNGTSETTQKFLRQQLVSCLDSFHLIFFLPSSFLFISRAHSSVSDLTIRPHSLSINYNKSTCHEVSLRSNSHYHDHTHFRPHY